MGGVNFHRVEASLIRAPGRSGEARDDTVDAGAIQRQGDLKIGIVGVVRNGAGAHRLPVLITQLAPLFFGGELLRTIPGHRGRCLASGMGKLDADSCALTVEEVHNAGEGGDVLVFVDAQITIGDACLGQHAAGFEHDEAEAAHAEPPQMHEMPVGGEAIDG